jgi:hypothetical protein
MWKHVYASVAGTFHLKSSMPCQDASRVEVITDGEGNAVLVAAASDGAGSAALAQLGARMACDLFVDEVRSRIESGDARAVLSDSFLVDWIDKFRQRVIGWSGAVGARIQDYACTLLAAVIWRDRAIYFQLGDGAIVESRREEPDVYSVVCWPQQGEYANTTRFLTDDDAAENIFYEMKPGAVDEIAIFTDGIQRLALDYRSQSAHKPFFDPLFLWLRQRGVSHSRELSDLLAVYLKSEKISSRTDDDKTLILATRRQE